MTTLRFTIPNVGKSISRPLLRVELLNQANGRVVRALACVDTGSDKCCFPARLAIKLGHNLVAGKESLMTAFDGSSYTAYLHTNLLRLQDPDGNEAKYRVRMLFSESLQGIGLLGIDGFLSHFYTTIDYRNSTLTLKEY